MPASVLCVDPDPHFCEILAKSLSEQGYDVAAVQNGASALDTIAESGSDLVLIDVQLPRRNGFELLEQIRRLPGPVSQIPVFLLMHGKITPANKDRARAAGATAMLTKPVSLTKLKTLVLKHIKESPPRVVESGRPKKSKQSRSPKKSKESDLRDRAKSEPVAQPTDEVPLEGDLRDLDFPSLLHHLHGLRATGALVLTSGRKRKVVQIREGYPVAIKSNLIGECFGNLLVQRGVITQEVFDESVARLKRGEGLQGQILVAMQVMDEEEVSAALVEQAQEKLFEMFEWRSGGYAFTPGGRLRGGIAIAQQRSPAAWILEGVRERYPIGLIDKRLGKQASRFVARSESPFYQLQEVELSAVERTVLSGVNGRQRAGSFARSDEPVRRAVFGLLLTGLLELSRQSCEQQRAAGGQAGPKDGAGPAADSDRALRIELAALAERLRRQTYFQILGVGEDATVEEIDAAFEEVARRAHPDRYQHATAAVRGLADDVFQRLEAARETLCDPRRRKEYELELRKGEREARKEKQDRRALEAEVEFQRGESMLRDRSYEAALLCFGNALERAPEEGEYIAHYGWCLYLCHPDESAMVEEAIEHVRRGLKLARDHEKPYLFLGRLYKAIGRAEAAEKMFTRAVQIQPGSVEALRELRLINLRRRKKGLIGRILRR